MMRLPVQFASLLLACAVSCGIACAESGDKPNLSRAQLKQMEREAHTADEYRTLASYFRWRQADFDRQAHDELVFWARRSMNVSLAAAKYPAPADSSRNRYDYFVYEAQKMSAQASHFESLSAKADR